MRTMSWNGRLFARTIDPYSKPALMHSFHTIEKGEPENRPNYSRTYDRYMVI